MNKQSKVKINAAHKNTLKSALSSELDNILKGKTMENEKRRPSLFRQLAVPMAIITVLVLGAVGVNLQNGEITARKAFAEAQMYYEDAEQRGRYLYQKAEIKNDFPAEIPDLGFGGTIIIERWYDTVTETERTKTTNAQGQVLDESLEIDGEFYINFNEDIDDFGGPNSEEFKIIDELFMKDDNNNDLPDVYEDLGFKNYKDLEKADLSPAEEDKLFKKAGLPEPNAFLKEVPAELSPDGLDPYNTKPSEYEELYAGEFKGPGLSQQEEYEQCVEEENRQEKTSELEFFYEGKGSLSEYAELFNELAQDDFYEIELVDWFGREAFEISFESFAPIPGEDAATESIYLAKDNYAFIGAESDFGEQGGNFSMRILTEDYTDDAFDTSTEGFDKDFGSTGTVVGLEDGENEEFEFSCEFILEGFPEELQLAP